MLPFGRKRRVKLIRQPVEQRSVVVIMGRFRGLRKDLKSGCAEAPSLCRQAVTPAPRAASFENNFSQPAVQTICKLLFATGSLFRTLLSGLEILREEDNVEKW